MYLCCVLRRVGHGSAHDEGLLVHVDLEGVDVVLVQIVHLAIHVNYLELSIFPKFPFIDIRNSVYIGAIRGGGVRVPPQLFYLSIMTILTLYFPALNSDIRIRVEKT